MERISFWLVTGSQTERERSSAGRVIDRLNDDDGGHKIVALIARLYDYKETFRSRVYAPRLLIVNLNTQARLIISFALRYRFLAYER